MTNALDCIGTTRRRPYFALTVHDPSATVSLVLPPHLQPPPSTDHPHLRTQDQCRRISPFVLYRYLLLQFDRSIQVMPVCGPSTVAPSFGRGRPVRGITMYPCHVRLISPQLQRKVVVCGDGACGKQNTRIHHNSQFHSWVERIGKTSLLNVFTRGFFTQV